MIYFDNAATSFPKPQHVIDEVRRAVSEIGGNPGRSGHSLSLAASEEIYETREAVADFFGSLDPARVVFTLNATHALNIAIKTTVLPHSRVLISDMEHNAVVRPLAALREKELIAVDVFKSHGVTVESILGQVEKNTSCIVSSLVSNVNGRSIPLALLSEAARRADLPLIVDGSQAAGHIPIDLSKTPCTVFCAPSHKGLFGIQGSGFAIFSDDRARRTLIEGGSGSASKEEKMPRHLPEHFEAGTLPTPAIISLRAGIESIRTLGGIEAVSKKINHLTEYAEKRLKEIKNLEFLGSRCGIAAFNLRGLDCEKAAERLSDTGFALRAGFHCAPLMHKTIGTYDRGCLRMSLSVLNTEEEIDKLGEEIERESIRFPIV